MSCVFGPNSGSRCCCEFEAAWLSAGRLCREEKFAIRKWASKGTQHVGFVLGTRHNVRSICKSEQADSVKIDLERQKLSTDFHLKFLDFSDTAK